MDGLSTGVIVALVSVVATQVISIIITVLFSRGKSIKENTHAIIKLTTQMEIVIKSIEDMPKLKGDVNSAFKKIREMSNEH